MTSPRFRPRSYCEPAEHFGTELPVRWRNAARMSSAELDQREASRMQHSLARRIGTVIKAEDSTIGKYADEVGITYSRMRRLLSGEIIMRLEDVANTDRHLRLRQRLAEGPSPA